MSAKRDPAKINQKAPIFGDRRTKRNRDRSTRERTARDEQESTYCETCGEYDCEEMR